jgi:integrase
VQFRVRTPDYGYANENPCLGIRRIRERPRKALPIAGELDAFLAWLRGKGKQWAVIAAMAEFAARAGSRRCEFLRATRFQIRDGEARLDRAKQRGSDMTDIIEITPALTDTLAAIMRPGCEYLFPSRFNRPYTEQGFKALFSRAMREALAAGVVSKRFTFHDLRAHYATQHKRALGALPDLHVDPGTTARVYERSRESRRKSL